MTRVAIAGIAGRMGRSVAPLVHADAELTLVGGVVRPGSDVGRAAVRTLIGDDSWDGRVVDDPTEILSEVDVLVDFTEPAGTMRQARACREAGRALVSGTTGLDAQQLDDLRDLARDIPVLHAPNLSIGVATLLSVLPEMVSALSGYDIEIVETHHRGKADAPSGTALAITETLKQSVRNRSDSPLIYGRYGVGQRREGEIGLHAVRAGGNPGEHMVVLASDDEQLTIGHRSFNRNAYALGAVRAVRFVAGAPAGFYSMTDLVRERIAGSVGAT